MACERCWYDAGMRAMNLGGSTVDHYYKLLEERKNNPCSPEDVRGDFRYKEGENENESSNTD